MFTEISSQRAYRNRRCVLASRSWPLTQLNCAGSAIIKAAQRMLSLQRVSGAAVESQLLAQLQQADTPTLISYESHASKRRCYDTPQPSLTGRGYRYRAMESYFMSWRLKHMIPDACDTHQSAEAIAGPPHALRTRVQVLVSLSHQLLQCSKLVRSNQCADLHVTATAAHNGVQKACKHHLLLLLLPT